MFALLPLGQRVIDKLTAIIDEEMRHIGAQKLLLPLLTSGHLRSPGDNVRNPEDDTRSPDN